MRPGDPPSPKKARDARYVVQNILLGGYRGPAHGRSLLRLLTGVIPQAPMLVGQVCRLCSEGKRGSDPFLTWGNLSAHIEQEHPLIRKALEEEAAYAEIVNR